MLKFSAILNILFFCMLACSTQNANINKSTSFKIQYLYTSSPALYSRIYPSLKSRTKISIPFGTKLKVKKTKHISSYLNKKSNWYYDYYSKGYVFGAYLRKENPKINKKLEIFFITESGKIQTDLLRTSNERIILYKNKFKYFINYESFHGNTYTYHQGTYLIKGNKIILDPNYSKRVSKGIMHEDIHSKKFDWNKKFTKYLKLKKIKLYWMHFLPGFLLEENLKVLNRRTFFLNRKKRYFISYKDIKAIKSENGYYAKIGYFFF